MLLTSGGRYAAAQALYERALNIRRATLGPTDAETLRTASSLANLRSLSGDYAGAADDYRRIVEARRRQGESLELAETLEELGDTEAALGRFGEAERIGEEALAMRRALFATGDVQIARGLLHNAYLRERLGDLEGAERGYRESLALFEAAPDQSANQVLVLGRLGKLRMERDEPAAALTLFDEALQRAQAGFPEWHYVVLSGRRQQGECLARLGRYDEAERQLVLSLEGYRRAAGEQHPMTRAVAEALADVRARRAGDSAALPTPPTTVAAGGADDVGGSPESAQGRQGRRP
jgi:tetratricopeptide (TPR) repeat protein